MPTEKETRKLLMTSFESAVAQCRLHRWQWKVLEHDGICRTRPIYADPKEPGDLLGLYVRGGFVVRVDLPEDGWLGDCELINYGAER